MATNICPPLMRLFEEVKTGRPLDYTPMQLAEEFEKYIQSLTEDPIRVSSKYIRQSRKQRLMRDLDEKQQQERVEEIPRAPHISDFVNRWLGNTMGWWGNLSREEYHKDWQSFLYIKQYISNYVRNVKLNGAYANIFNPSIVARELGLADKQNVEQTVKQVNINVNSADEAERMKRLGELI
jgi:hypothetical protein